MYPVSFTDNEKIINIDIDIIFYIVYDVVNFISHFLFIDGFNL
jgi:hypothetical protein